MSMKLERNPAYDGPQGIFADYGNEEEDRMGACMIIQMCKGLEKPPTKEQIAAAVQIAVSSLNENTLSYLDSVFNYRQELDEAEDERAWLMKKLKEAAKEIYLEDRDDVTWLTLDETKWMATGGSTWGDDPTEATPLIQWISETGLDFVLITTTQE